MDIILSFIIKPFVASGLLYFYYLLALKNKRFHTYNRFYLLLSVVISCMVPFMNFGWLNIQTASPNPIIDPAGSGLQEANAGPALSTEEVLFIIAGMISSFLLLSLVINIIKIYQVKRSNKAIKMERYTFIETDLQQAPFSFLSNLFWKQGLSAADANGGKILKHELAHIMQKHTYDKLFTQVLCCLVWFNPFYWLIQKELNTVHEFLADAAAIEDGDTESLATMLLYSHNEGRYLSPSHTFFNSSIKRRLIMISSSKNIRYSFSRRLLALPMALFVLAISSISVNAQTDTAKVKKHKPSSLEPITVKGYKSEKKASQEPITVEGYQSGKKTTKAKSPKKQQKPSLEPVIVEGYKLEKKPELEHITVEGYQVQQKPVTNDPSVNLKKTPGEQVVTVTGYKKPAQQLEAGTQKQQADVQEVVVTGYKTVNKSASNEVNEYKQQPPSVEHVVVTNEGKSKNKMKDKEVSEKGKKKSGKEPSSEKGSKSTKKMKD